MKDLRQQHFRPPSPLLMVIFLAICQILAAVAVHSANSTTTLIGDHICYRNESFTELEQQRSTEPVRIREYGWCLGFPPRCSKYRTETKEIVKYQNVTKHRSISECCEGYIPLPTNGSQEVAKCIPTCPNGCENGVCSEPYKCECFVGYLGVNCGKACDKGKWGMKCDQHCDCPSFSCDPVSGVCIECLEGWTGQDCNTRCPKSYYGRDCKNKCDSCPGQECDFKSGECLMKPTTTTTSTTTTTTPVPSTSRTSTITSPLTTQPLSTTTVTESLPPPPTTTTANNSLLHIHTIDAKSTSNSKAITVLNTTISGLQTNVKNLERQVDEHKRLIVSTTTTPSPVDLTFVHLSTTGTLTSDTNPDEDDENSGVFISPHPEVSAGGGGGHLVEVPLEPPEVVLHVENNHNLQDHNGTKIEDKVERHASILIALIAVLCVIATGCVGYFCLRRRCFLFPVKSGKVRPHASTVELNDVKTMTIEKPLPAIPVVHEQHRPRSGSVKSVTFDEKLTYYGDGTEEKPPAEGTFAHHFYDEVKYPPTLSEKKFII